MSATSDTVYTAITFAPVQGFIENSRKLRDLYGSSYILSHLARAVCALAKPDQNRALANHKPWLVSPAHTNVTQGTPNLILIQGELDRKTAQDAFDQAWKSIIEECRGWIEENLTHRWAKGADGDYHPTETPETPWDYTSWHSNRVWEHWGNHAWEFFYATGKDIDEARQALEEVKRWRAWTGVNWVGESSTLSGADAVAIPSLGLQHPKHANAQAIKDETAAFYAQLSYCVGQAFIQHIQSQLKGQNHFPDQLIQRYGEGFLKFVKERLPKERDDLFREYGSGIIDPDEELSIPELVKRLITLDVIASKVGLNTQEVPDTFRDLNRLANKKRKPKQQPSSTMAPPPDNRWSGWFQGDGDRAGQYLQYLASKGGDPATATHNFSRAMLEWGVNTLKPQLDPTGLGRLIYAGGDDFFGVFYRTPPKPQFISPLVKALSEEAKTALGNDWSQQLPSLEQQVNTLGLHSSVTLPSAIRAAFVAILEHPPLSDRLKAALKEANLLPNEAIALFRHPVLSPQECLDWFLRFKPDIWSQHDHQAVTPSVGFVWAAPNVPQRDVLQHCREAESQAKASGRDRLALRILFNSGTYLEWVCPWRFLPVLQDYCDRNRQPGAQQNWSHLYTDVGTLEARHAFQANSNHVARALLNIYFRPEMRDASPWQPADRETFYGWFQQDDPDLLNHPLLWNHYVGSDPYAPEGQRVSTGILGDRQAYTTPQGLDTSQICHDVNAWVINLAKVGFHLCSNI